MSHDEAKRRVLARRARFMAAAGIAGAALTASAPAHAEDASIDDAGADGSIFVEAGVRADGGIDGGDDDDFDGAPPTPCLSMRKPEEPQACLCAAAPITGSGSNAPVAPAIVAAGAAVAALRRRKKKR
jgi:hypothetical protein